MIDLVGPMPLRIAVECDRCDTRSDEKTWDEDDAKDVPLFEIEEDAEYEALCAGWRLIRATKGTYHLCAECAADADEERGQTPKSLRD